MLSRIDSATLILIALILSILINATINGPRWNSCTALLAALPIALYLYWCAIV